MVDPFARPTMDDDPELTQACRDAVQRAGRQLVEDLRAEGVIQAFASVGYHLDPSICLITETDAQAETLLRTRGIPRDLIIQRCIEAGMRPDLAHRGGGSVDSQETVDRDYGGNWWVYMK